MEDTTPYRYEANNEESYKSLAAYAVTITATVTLHPGLHTIVISGDAAKEVGQFIDDNGLDFHINPIEVHDENLGSVIYSETTDASTLRKILCLIMAEKKAMAEAHKNVLDDITKENKALTADRDRFAKWHSEAYAREDRIKKQIAAIAVLVDAIVQ